ncbi:hypothetical protein MASR2M16_24660 [Thauera terpenica]
MHTSGKAIIETEQIPIKLWLDEEQMDEGALEQARNLANLPFAFKHIAIMPDTHEGYGMPIGAILATQGAIVPNAVGVDIGCGMCSLRTNLTEVETADLKAIMGIIRDTVPVGFNHHKTPRTKPGCPSARAICRSSSKSTKAPCISSAPWVAAIISSKYRKDRTATSGS